VNEKNKFDIGAPTQEAIKITKEAVEKIVIFAGSIATSAKNAVENSTQSGIDTVNNMSTNAKELAQTALYKALRRDRELGDSADADETSEEN
jgi:hypothetical protein